MPNEGIVEKLRRLKENILNLEAEIGTFFQEGEYRVLPEDNRELLLNAIEYHKNGTIPHDSGFSQARSSIICGRVSTMWSGTSPLLRTEQYAG